MAPDGKAGERTGEQIEDDFFDDVRDLKRDEDRYLQQLGEVIQQERIGMGLTAEQAARSAEVAYKTWLRIESGEPVRNMTWSGVDRLFDLDEGTTLRFISERRDVEQFRTVIEKTNSGALWSTEEAENYLRQRTERAARNQRIDFPVPYRLTPEAYKKIANKPIPSTAGNLVDRVSGLSLDELRRLRDMVDAAIASKEHPAIDEELATAAVDATEASARVNQLEEALDVATERLGRSAADNLQQELVSALSEARLELEAKARNARQSLAYAHERYAALKYKAAAVERGKKMFDSSGREETGEERGDG
jgi:transcriptional regulator with XRE-family HTH domain